MITCMRLLGRMRSVLAVLSRIHALGGDCTKVCGLFTCPALKTLIMRPVPLQLQVWPCVLTCSVHVMGLSGHVSGACNTRTSRPGASGGHWLDPLCICALTAVIPAVWDRLTQHI